MIPGEFQAHRGGSPLRRERLAGQLHGEGAGVVVGVAAFVGVGERQRRVGQQLPEPGDHLDQAEGGGLVAQAKRRPPRRRAQGGEPGVQLRSPRPGVGLAVGESGAARVAHVIWRPVGRMDEDEVLEHGEP